MADDDMEISSVHGHNAGDEDIDIDIDLTTGQPDEDYMLEDAQSNNAMEDTFQPSPTMNDDLMLDDENISFTMDDDTLQVPEDHTMEHETSALSFIEMPQDDSVALNDDPSETLPAVDEEVMQEAETIFDLAVDKGATIGQDTDLEQVEPRYGVEDGEMLSSEHIVDGLDGSADQQNQPQDSEVINDEAEEEETSSGIPNQETEVVDDPESASRSGSPQTQDQHPNNSSQVQTNAETSQTTNANEHENSPEPLKEDLEKTVDQASNHDAKSGGDELPPHDDSHELTPAQKVIVVYNSIEYKLFSGPEDNDPDSFFLSDISICEKPIGDLFSAIREIIYDELSDGDELVITIQELRIDIEETSSSITAVSFQQLVDAREKMLQNNGSESPEPLFIILGKRKSLETKISMMNTWGEEGKDLSEIRWDEYSDDNVDASEFANDEFDNSSHLSNIESGDEAEGEFVDPHKEVADPGDLTQVEQHHEAEEEEKSLPEEVNDRHDTLLPEQHEDNDPTVFNIQLLEAEEGIDIPSASLIAQDGPATTLMSQPEPADLGDDDGDLIDYEDEEAENDDPQNTVHEQLNGTSSDFLLPCIKPKFCLCLKCNEILMQGYEMLNEELRRRSMSRTAEVDLGWETNEATSNTDTWQEIDTDPENADHNDNHDVQQDEYSAKHDHEDDSGEQNETAVGATLDEAESPSGTDHDEQDPEEIDRFDEQNEEGEYEYHDSEVVNEQDVNEQEHIEPKDPISLSGITGPSVLPSSDLGSNIKQGENDVVLSGELKDTDQDGGNQDYLDLEADIGNSDVPTTKEARSEASSNGVTEAADSESATIASANTLDVDEINYDELDESTVETTTTATHSIPANGDLLGTLETTSRDEIDYDDDDEEGQSSISHVSATPTKQAAIFSGSLSTKRPRAESELEDAMDASSKEAKRVRS